MKYSIVVAATASEAAPLQYLAPFTGKNLVLFFFNLGFCSFLQIRLLFGVEVTKRSRTRDPVFHLNMRTAFPSETHFLFSPSGASTDNYQVLPSPSTSVIPAVMPWSSTMIFRSRPSPTDRCLCCSVVLPDVRLTPVTFSTSTLDFSSVLPR